MKLKLKKETYVCTASAEFFVGRPTHWLLWRQLTGCWLLWWLQGLKKWEQALPDG
jgi:hypothetical protein